MAGEIQYLGPPSATTYVNVRSTNSGGMIWSVASGMWDDYATGSIDLYDIAGTQQGTASRYYTASFPTAIAPGVYNVQAKYQAGGSPAESDTNLGVGSIEWGGSTIGVIPLSSLPSSGITAAARQVLLQRARMVQNFPIYLKSATDHVTPLTSGNVSGQIMRDNGNFGPLQSGAFTEVGQGWYRLQALTSGDLTANTVALLFTATGVSGGVSDPLAMSVVLQPSSGF